MKRFKNILVAASDRDGLAQSVGVAGALAERNGASLHLVDTLRPFPSYTRMLGPDVYVDELEESVRMTRLSALEPFASGLEDRGLQVTTEVLRGTPFVEIIGEVERDGTIFW